MVIYAAGMAATHSTWAVQRNCGHTELYRRQCGHKYCASSTYRGCCRPAGVSRAAAGTVAAAASLPGTSTDLSQDKLPLPGTEADEWVEVGRIGSPHGVRGEMKVQPLTDFPEERLATSGTRWLQAPVPKLGRRQAQLPVEVELEWGRSMISKGNEVWLVKLEGVESPEEAALLRGHTLLIPAAEREPLEDGDEFYVQDLVGLRVFLQSSGDELGHVADVFDGTGTHDVLRIQLAASMVQQLVTRQQAAEDSEDEEQEEEERQAVGQLDAAAPAGRPSGEQDGESASDAPAAARHRGGGAGEAYHVLLPFVKALVPVVDLGAHRMEVTPPDGLLELAVPSNQQRKRQEQRGKRERRRTRPKGQAAVEAGVKGAAANSRGAE